MKDINSHKPQLHFRSYQGEKPYIEIGTPLLRRAYLYVWYDG